MHVVVVRKGYCLPTSYQNVGVVSVIPTCLQSFMHPSILVRELHKDTYSHCSLLWCEKGVVYQQVIRMLVSYRYSLPVSSLGPSPFPLITRGREERVWRQGLA